MRKILSILFALLILISGLHVTIARHYCGCESVAFEKISVSGELASCGMESADDSVKVPGTYFKAHCCDDEVTVLAVDANYSPSQTIFKTLQPTVLHIFNIAENFHIQTPLVFNHFNTNELPPGNYLANAVSLPDICVFRI